MNFILSERQPKARIRPLEYKPISVLQLIFDLHNSLAVQCHCYGEQAPMEQTGLTLLPDDKSSFSTVQRYRQWSNDSTDLLRRNVERYGSEVNLAVRIRAWNDEE